MSSLEEITIENYGQHSSETQSSDQSLVAFLNNRQNLDVESVIKQEQHKLVLSEATTDLAYPITACQKHPSKQPVIMPTQQQEQKIYIITNGKNNRNWKKTFKNNWWFITAIFALTIICMFLIKVINNIN